jgi:sulfoxide reductase heme-binding subunit YedZ
MLATSSTTLWYSTRATGIVALVLLTMTMVLGILTAGRVRTRSWPAFAQADLHKRVSVLAVVFLGIHVLTAVLDTYVNIGWASIVVPFNSTYQPLWTGLGTVAVDLMIAVAVSSALRQRISARAWRTIHWSAYASWPVAMAHSLGEGTDGLKLWMDVLAGACALAVAGALTWRIVDYRRHRRTADQVGALTRVVPARHVRDSMEAGPAVARSFPAASPAAGVPAPAHNTGPARATAAAGIHEDRL